MAKNLFQDTDIVSIYTRQQAIDDGVLIDVSDVAREAGIKYPVALTRAVWDDVVEPDSNAISHGESVEGRLWDVLWMFKVAARNTKGNILLYKLLATRHGKQHMITLKGICEPGDTLEPVITIMLPDED